MGERERVGHCATDQDVIADAEQVVDDIDLVADLCPAQDRDEGPRGIPDRVTEVLNLLGDQVTDDSRLPFHRFGNGEHRSVFSVTGSEGIVAVHVGHRSKLGSEFGVALLFAGIETQILEHQHIAVRQLAGFCGGVLTNGVGRKGDGLTLVPGMVFTIEPMINLGERYLRVLDDDWTAVTRDGSLSAQFEQTILVTDDGYESLTPYDL